MGLDEKHHAAAKTHASRAVKKQMRAAAVQRAEAVSFVACRARQQLHNVLVE